MPWSGDPGQNQRQLAITFAIGSRHRVARRGTPESNPHITFAVTGAGTVTRSLSMASGLDGTFVMHNLHQVGPDVLQYDETGRQSELTVSIIKQSDGKFRSWRSVRSSGPQKGEVLIENGKFVKSGTETQAFALCQSKQRFSV